MEAAKRQNSDFKLRALLDAQPVKVAQNRRHVVEFPPGTNESRGSVHYELQFVQSRDGKSVECGIAIVQSGQHKRHHEGLEDRPRETATDATNSPQDAKTSSGYFGNVVVHR